MYGMIHKAARELAIQEFGQDSWDSILQACELDDRHFISGQHYDDATTMKLIGEMVRQTGMPAEDLLTAFGHHWIKFVGVSVYQSVIEMTGDNLVTFIENLNRMHDSIKATMPKAVLPSFLVSENSAAHIKIIYKSPRKGFESFVKGLLEGLIDKFGERGEVSFSILNDRSEFLIERQAGI